MLENMKKEFISPSNEYTAVPLWFWNDDLKEDEIIRQINDFKSKGIMGFVIHPRLGITQNIQYMSDKYLQLVEIAVEEAEKLGMIVFLYDEASYPSGSAHGMVVEGNPEYASRGLKMIEYNCNGETELVFNNVIKNEVRENVSLVSIQAVKKLSEKEIDPGSIEKLELNSGKIKFIPPDNGNWSILFFIDTPSHGTIRGIHFGEDDGEPGAPPSADILNPDAVRKFINLTHEKYYEKLKKHFGKTIKAIFTDEPGITGRGYIPGLKPWTGNFLEYYINNGCKEQDLPALWFEVGKETEEKRKKYYKVVNRRLQMAYYRQISEWCEQHNIALTGHPEKSEDIGVLKHFQIPCQDVVWRWVAPENNLAIEGPNSTMGKCSSDAARHIGRQRNGNECFGCCYRNGEKGTTYDLPPEDIKWYLDWLFVRGVNLIIPHAFFYSVNGEKRLNERPPDIGPNNLYWPHYMIISEYIKRMSWLMTGSINVTEIAVLCGHDYLPWKVVKPLFENQIEFNYLEDNLLISNECTIEEGKIKIKTQSYTTIIVEDSTMICGDTAKKLQNFINKGGNVIIVNEEEVANSNNTHRNVRKEHSNYIGKESVNLNGTLQIKDARCIISTIESIVKKDIILTPENKDIRVSHVIKGDTHFYLMVNEGENAFDGRVKLKTKEKLQKWDAVEGTICNIDVANGNDKYDEYNKYIEFNTRLERRESTIFCIDASNIGEDNGKSDIGNNKDNKNDRVIKGSRNIKSDRHPENDTNIKGEEIEIKLSSGWDIRTPLFCMECAGFLESWAKWKGMENYSGTISYYNEFIIDDINELVSVRIDLGKVCEIAQLFINDREVGVKLWGPFVFNIRDFMKQGVNTVKVNVTNSLANRINKAKLDSGLIGPCIIRIAYLPNHDTKRNTL